MECWQVAGAKEEVGTHLPGLRSAPRADVASPPPARAERKKGVGRSPCSPEQVSPGSPWIVGSGPALVPASQSPPRQQDNIEK